MRRGLPASLAASVVSPETRRAHHARPTARSTFVMRDSKEPCREGDPIRYPLTLTVRGVLSPRCARDSARRHGWSPWPGRVSGQKGQRQEEEAPPPPPGITP